ncbi:E3 ubiquitin-protein ligase RNF34 [Palaemon carinicauda]|uniref:E3 ubiquitin-protein ligase RNF34 n=1 Tax=Palaemon carinicauda TaxID=392227 RepID=UPI0035B597F8
MQGGSQGCVGPFSWLCQEAWRCSPRVFPSYAAAAGAPEMGDCDQCSAKFTILKRKRNCDGCGLSFCHSCAKRGAEGTRHCNKCRVLSQWPLDRTQVEALRVKDLRHFLHSRHINTISCTEKRDLIDLVTRHICRQHGVSGGSTQGTNSSNENHNFPRNGQPQNKPATSPVTRDDGIRVRPCNSPDNDISSMGSIRVRPMDSIRVRPGRPVSPDSNDYDPETDLGIRVFASDFPSRPQQRESSVSPVSVDGCSESVEEACSRCPSEDCTTSCCSLDSCHNGASSQPCPHKAEHSGHCSLEDVSVSSEGRVPSSASSDFPPHRRPNSLAQDDQPQSIHNPGLEGTSQSCPQTFESPLEVPETAATDVDEPMDLDHPASTIDEEPQVPLATSPSSASSSTTFPSESSSPEPAKQFGPGIVSLGDLKTEDDIRRLSIRQCKEVLAFHRVNLSGVREKSELTNKIIILWKDYQASRQSVDSLPEELVCKICMDNVIDCVLLECGHMVACTQCGKQMAECPVCRQFVVRVVRTFRA